MKTKSYSELLKDPRWQKKRLEILERDKWTCQSCNSTTKTLNIHHLLYIPGRNPWEYSNKLLLTLCEMCHKENKNVTNLIYNESINEMIERALIDNKSLTFDNVTFFLSECMSIGDNTVIDIFSYANNKFFEYVKNIKKNG